MQIRLETTRERDIDLLIIEEFISDKEFAKIFLEPIGIHEQYVIEEIFHSKTETDLGESDIVFVLNIDNKRHALHIEDKINATAMQDQYIRYTFRAQKDIASGMYDTFSVIIVAPNKYLKANKEAQKYQHQISYEQLRNYFLTKTDLRSKYKLALVDRALSESKNGYQHEANPAVECFCKAMYAYQKEIYPALPTGSIAWWPGYQTLQNDAKIIFKANKGYCDLQFGHTTAKNLYSKVKYLLSERMAVIQTGLSASVRIVVTPIWFENKFDEHIPEVDEALAAINELYELAKII
ncbi:MAG: hypothetical protein E7460_04035 [Ruminococcaceae bacterium]|nr:hypothetical protein [Oscillospiraceae bacterium]